MKPVIGTEADSKFVVKTGFELPKEKKKKKVMWNIYMYACVCLYSNIVVFPKQEFSPVFYDLKDFFVCFAEVITGGEKTSNFRRMI